MIDLSADLVKAFERKIAGGKSPVPILSVKIIEPARFQSDKASDIPAQRPSSGHKLKKEGKVKEIKG
jgi:hypothetical protein